MGHSFYVIEIFWLKNFQALLSECNLVLARPIFCSSYRFTLYLSKQFFHGEQLGIFCEVLVDLVFLFTTHMAETLIFLYLLN